MELTMLQRDISGMALHTLPHAARGHTMLVCVYLLLASTHWSGELRDKHVVATIHSGRILFETFSERDSNKSLYERIYYRQSLFMTHTQTKRPSSYLRLIWAITIFFGWRFFGCPFGYSKNTNYDRLYARVVCRSRHRWIIQRHGFGQFVAA